MEDLVQLIFFVLVALVYVVGAVLKKVNDWINEKRMMVDRHPSEEGRATRQGDLSSQPPIVTSAPPRRSFDETDIILEQLEAMLPPEVRAMSQETWLRMILMSAAVVFVLDLLANVLSFSSRLGNALVTALLFAVLLGVLVYTTGGIPAELPKPI